MSWEYLFQNHHLHGENMLYSHHWGNVILPQVDYSLGGHILPCLSNLQGLQQIYYTHSEWLHLTSPPALCLLLQPRVHVCTLQATLKWSWVSFDCKCSSRQTNYVARLIAKGNGLSKRWCQCLIFLSPYNNNSIASDPLLKRLNQLTTQNIGNVVIINNNFCLIVGILTFYGVGDFGHALTRNTSGFEGQVNLVLNMHYPETNHFW